jgi:hypothetical protein
MNKWSIVYADGVKEEITADKIRYLPDGSFRLLNSKPVKEGEPEEEHEVLFVGCLAYRSICRV